MTNPLEKVKELIQGHLADAEVLVTDLTGTRDHIGLTVISDVFKGKPLLEQHQMIMDILKNALKSEIHAVQIKTVTKENYLKKKA